MRVALIPTGRLELLALPAALGRLFPGHDFYAVAKRERAKKPKEPLDSFTSARHPLPSTNLTRLVSKLGEVLMPDRGKEPADVAVLIDDLELFNVDQPEVVVGVVRKEVKTYLDGLARKNPRFAPKVAQAFLNRASFHLAVPMIESWLLADPAGPTRAGVPGERLPVRLKAGVDPEHMETDDPAFSCDDGSACAQMQAQAKRKRIAWLSKKARPTWCIEPHPELPRVRREHHPKAYLSWLCRDPEDDKCSTYRESHGGADALRELHWSAVLGSPQHCTFARSLIADLADALGESRPDAFAGAEAPSTARHCLPPDPVLRNV